VPRRAELAAERLLAQHGVTGPPVDAEKLATAEGVLVVHRRFDDAEVSGSCFGTLTTMSSVSTVPIPQCDGGLRSRTNSATDRFIQAAS
jgi:hypothetical protein